MKLTPWLEQMSIQDKDTGRVFKLSLDPAKSEFAWAQRAVVEEIERQHALGQPVRIMVLKARQLGISTIAEATTFQWNFLFPGTHSLVIAHESSASRHLYEMSKLMWNQWELRDLFTEAHNTQRSLGWLETRSQIEIATARNVGSGRSFTYRAVHGSECAFWEDADALMTGLYQSVPYVPGTLMILESTANGVGNWWYDEWYRAIDAKSTFIPMFFPWWRHMPYSIPNATLTPSAYTSVERDLVRHVQILHDYTITPQQIAWRRFKIAEGQGDEAKFRQEYPATPEEAFIMSGTSVFSLQAIDDCYAPETGITGLLYRDGGRIKFRKDCDGPLRLFREPGDAPWASYVVVGDPARTIDGDGACAQVLNRKTLEQVAVYHGHAEPIEFAHELMHLGYFYNTAQLNVEIEGPGHATIATLLNHDYPDVWRHRWFDKAPGKVSNTFGWSSNYNRKQAAKGALSDFLCNQVITIHDSMTYDQLRRYVYLGIGTGEMGPNSRSGNDDAVTSLMIACATVLYNDQDDSYDAGVRFPLGPQFGGTPQILVGAGRGSI